MIDLSQFMPDCNDLVPRKLLAEIIQARVRRDLYDGARGDQEIRV